MGNFQQSIFSWIENFSINSVIMLAMMIFMLVGAVDRIRGNPLGYGEKFEEGFHAIGALALSMAGVVAAAPVLSRVLGPVVTPFYRFLGADPAMFAGTLLACDMGGYNLALELTEDPAVARFSGLILGTTLGPTVVFTIPVALSVLNREDTPYLGAGVLAGLITIPLGCLAGGLAMSSMTRYTLTLGQMLLNLLPVLLIAGLIVAGLWLAPAKMIRGFQIFGREVTAVVTVLTAIAVFQQITGILLPVFDVMVMPGETGLTPLDLGLLTCGQIGIVLIGAFPMIEWITRTFGTALRGLGKSLGINPSASSGLIATLANSIPTFQLIGDMDPRGKLLNMAFAVSGSFVFGDHLGFTAGVDQSMVVPVIIGKLTAAVTAVITASILAPGLLSRLKA